MTRIIGIDLGTTNSCVAVLEGDTATVIHNQEGKRTTPSMVSWANSGEVVVGTSSKRQMVTNPQKTVYGVKRLLGRKFAEEHVQHLQKTLPYEVISHTNGDAWVKIGAQRHAPPAISAHILAQMRTIAEEYLGEAVSEAIITVPAYFDDVQRQATKDAGLIAGLTVRSIVNEPTAAALAYGLHQQTNQRIAVFDLGGGTFDISILTIEDGVFEVLSTSGDTQIGGDDFDRVLIDALIKQFAHNNQVPNPTPSQTKNTPIDLLQDPASLQRLKEAAEQAKVELSTALSTEINLPFLSSGPSGPIHFQREVSRGELESLCADLLAKLEGPCLKALSDAQCTAEDIDQVLLVGGMTRMPAVQSRVIEIFGKSPSKGVNPDEIVAAGAAIQSAVIGGELEEVILLDVTPHALGIRTVGNRMSFIIPANTTVPTRETKTFTTTADNQDFVSIEVYQGADENVSGNRRLGRFVLTGLPKKKKGDIKVEVSFTMDADGILKVSAREQESGKVMVIRIEAQSGLTEGERKKLSVQHP